MTSQAERLQQFRGLQAPGRLLVLPNAWDAASARLAAELGAEAIATSSAALAWCHGYADGETLPAEVTFAAVREILRVVEVPVSVDSEAGYSADPATVAEFVLTLIDLGAVGINLEDGRERPELLADKIRAIKSAARGKSADIFINARCDVYLKNLVADEAKFAEAMRRGALYREAGADGFFLPGTGDIAIIRETVTRTDLPLNVLIGSGVPPIAELKAAGVRRVSAGALISRTAYGAAQRAVKTLLGEGRYDNIFATASDCPNFNSWFGA
jgi:2-methylisocitrate lyase-like PEP mutase family enzyme